MDKLAHDLRFKHCLSLIGLYALKYFVFVCLFFFWFSSHTWIFQPYTISSFILVLIVHVIVFFFFFIKDTLRKLMVLWRICLDLLHIKTCICQEFNLNVSGQYWENWTLLPSSTLLVTFSLSFRLCSGE